MTRLERLDALADRLATAYLRVLRRAAVAALLLAGALALLAAGLFLLDLLSWGSRLEDYQPWLEDVDVPR